MNTTRAQAILSYLFNVFKCFAPEDYRHFEVELTKLKQSYHDKKTPNGVFEALMDFEDLLLTQNKVRLWVTHVNKIFHVSVEFDTDNNHTLHIKFRDEAADTRDPVSEQFVTIQEIGVQKRRPETKEVIRVRRRGKDSVVFESVVDFGEDQDPKTLVFLTKLKNHFDTTSIAALDYQSSRLKRMFEYLSKDLLGQ